MRFCSIAFLLLFAKSTPGLSGSFCKNVGRICCRIVCETIHPTNVKLLDQVFSRLKLDGRELLDEKVSVDRVDRDLSGDTGLRMSESLLAFNRGKTFLELQLPEINRRLDIFDPGKNLKRFQVERIYRAEVLKNKKVVAMDFLKLTCIRLKSAVFGAAK